MAKQCIVDGNLFRIRFGYDLVTGIRRQDKFMNVFYIFDETILKESILWIFYLFERDHRIYTQAFSATLIDK